MSNPIKMLMFLAAGGAGFTAFQDPAAIGQLTHSPEIQQVMEAIQPYVGDMKAAMTELQKQMGDLTK